MKELINKPQTKSGGETTNRNTLPFSNSAIKKYLPTFGNLRHKSISFKVPLKSHFKGLKLRVSKATKNKYFVLWYWFQGKYLPYTLGTYAPGFGVKEVSNKLFDIVKYHTNDKGLWIKDPSRYGGMIRGPRSGLVDVRTNWSEIFPREKDEYELALEELGEKAPKKNRYY